MGCGVIAIPEGKQRLYNTLISDVLSEIEEQIGIGDIEGVEELLTFVPTPFLIGFLDEERWEEFRRLKGVRSNGAGNLNRVG